MSKIIGFFRVTKLSQKMKLSQKFVTDLSHVTKVTKTSQKK